MRIISTILLSLFLITSTTFAEYKETILAINFPFNGNALFTDSNDSDKTNGATAQELVNKFDENLNGGLRSIAQFLKHVGIAVAFCTLAYMAVCIIISPPDKKAELKSAFTPYLVGLLLIIAGVPIAIFIINKFIEIFTS